MDEEEERREYLAWKASRSAGKTAPKKEEAEPTFAELLGASKNGGQTFSKLLKKVDVPEGVCDVQFSIQLFPKDEREPQEESIVLNYIDAAELTGVDFLKGLWGNHEATGELLDRLVVLSKRGKRHREAQRAREEAAELARKAEEAAARARAMESQPEEYEEYGGAGEGEEEGEEEEEEEAPPPPPPSKKKAKKEKRKSE